MDETQRLFVAIDLPDEVKTLLRTLQTQLGRHTRAVRWADPNGTHLTLKFLGPVPMAQIEAVTHGMQQAAQASQPLTLRTAAPGGFPNGQRPRVLWLGVAGDLEALRTLQAAVEREIAPLGFPTEQRPFAPHLTLGRSQKDPRPAELAEIGRALAQTVAPPPIAFEVREVVLMRSELRPGGARYTSVAHAALDGGT
jgi:2'-5' RNA ligase